MTYIHIDQTETRDRPQKKKVLRFAAAETRLTVYRLGGNSILPRPKNSVFFKKHIRDACITARVVQIMRRCSQCPTSPPGGNLVVCWPPALSMARRADQQTLWALLRKTNSGAVAYCTLQGVKHFDDLGPNCLIFENWLTVTIRWNLNPRRLTPVWTLRSAFHVLGKLLDIQRRNPKYSNKIKKWEIMKQWIFEHPKASGSIAIFFRVWKGLRKIFNFSDHWFFVSKHVISIPLFEKKWEAWFRKFFMPFSNRFFEKTVNVITQKESSPLYVPPRR